ncbi:MAG: chorismate synthase [Clostridia bacterium]|nr:chorismate synthase [Clostridia bacterium]
MKNTFGSALTLTIFGESHGPAVGCVLDGLAPGMDVDEGEIRRALTLRRPFGAVSTGRVEDDPFVIESGVFRGRTTGTPLTILIPNGNVRSSDYDALASLARPGHADLTAEARYRGFQDRRGGGHFSGRVTAALAAAGGILLPALRKKGVAVITHIREIAGIEDRPFGDIAADGALLSDKKFAVLDEAAGEKMQAAILAARADGDSVGGILETAVTGMPAGVGEPWFDTLEGELAKALFSMPGVKGVSFGAGFALARMRGSEADDPIRMIDGRPTVTGLSQGGINGGIANGSPILIQTAVKPTPTVARPLETVDLDKMENAVVTAAGRHDPCIVHRARIVADSLVALTLADRLTVAFGGGYLA